eukprot:evm.model.NODE_37290_length_11426_cov_35.999825.2
MTSPTDLFFPLTYRTTRPRLSPPSRKISDDIDVLVSSKKAAATDLGLLVLSYPGSSRGIFVVLVVFVGVSVEKKEDEKEWNMYLSPSSSP